MNEQKLINTEDYLEKLNQSNNEEYSKEIFNSRINLEKPIFNDRETFEKYTQYNNYNEDIVLKNELCILNFQYSKFQDENLTEKIKNYCLSKNGVEINDFRILEKFCFKLKDNDYTLDIFDILPKNYKIIFTPEIISTSKFESDGHIDPSNEYIYLYGDPMSKTFQIVLLHEIGHAIDDKLLKKNNFEKLVTDHRFSAQAEKLRKERIASAYAIKKLKPLVQSGFISKEDLFNYLKYYALNSHCLYIDDYISGVKREDHYYKHAIQDYDQEMKEFEDDYKNS